MTAGPDVAVTVRGMSTEAVAWPVTVPLRWGARTRRGHPDGVGPVDGGIVDVGKLECLYEGVRTGVARDGETVAPRTASAGYHPRYSFSSRFVDGERLGVGPIAGYMLLVCERRGEQRGRYDAQGHEMSSARIMT